MSSIKNYEEFIKSVGSEDAKKIIVEYLMCLFAKTQIQDLLEQGEGVMTEDELDNFIDSLACRALSEELNDLNNPKYKNIRSNKPYSRYLSGVMNTLKILGYSREWVENELKNKLDEKFLK